MTKTVDHQPRPTRTLPRPLTLYAALAAVLTLIPWSTASIAIHRGSPPPWTWPLFPPGNSYFDLFDYFTRFHHLHHAEFFTWPGYPFTYYAPGIPLYRFFYRLGAPVALDLYLHLTTALALLATALLALKLRLAGLRLLTTAAFALLCLLTSYPFFFCRERGNLEIFLAAGILAGLWAFWTGRPLLAAVLWGIFGSVKLYPLLFVALFLSTRQLRAFLLTLLTAALTTLASLAYTGPTIAQAFRGLQPATGAFLRIYAYTREGASWDHSLFGLLKPALLSRFDPPALLTTYLLLAGLTLLALYFLRIRHLPLLNQVVLLSVVEVLFPPTSFDYTLLQLYGALALLFFATLSPSPGASRAALTPALLLLAAILAPANLLLLHGVNQNGPFKAILLLALFLLALLRPFPGPAPIAPG